MKLAINKKTILNLIIVILVLAAIIYFGIKPLTQKSVSLYKDNKDKNAQLEKLGAEIDILKNLKITLIKEKTKIEKVLNYLPKKDVTNFVTQAEALAVGTGNSLKSVEFKEEKKPLVSVAGTKEKTFEIIISGNFVSINAFLDGLNKLTQFNNVYNISIDVTDEETSTIISGAIYTRTE